MISSVSSLEQVSLSRRLVTLWDDGDGALDDRIKAMRVAGELDEARDELFVYHPASDPSAHYSTSGHI
jgi:hypothetical protein